MTPVYQVVAGQEYVGPVSAQFQVDFRLSGWGHTRSGGPGLQAINDRSPISLWDSQNRYPTRLGWVENVTLV